MKRKIISFLVVLVALFSIIGDNSIKSPFESSPKSIKCTRPTIDSVVLLSENVLIVSKESVTAASGIASFETNGEIYLLGHKNFQPVGSFVIKVNESTIYAPEIDASEIDASNLIGEVISNTENGVIAKQSQTIREYSTIPIAKTAQLGEAFLLRRDDEGNIQEYSIIIEAFKEDQNMFLYSSPEIEFRDGLSGAPIIQNNELIGVHRGSTEDGKTGAARIIWSLEIVSLNEVS